MRRLSAVVLTLVEGSGTAAPTAFVVTGASSYTAAAGRAAGRSCSPVSLLKSAKHDDEELEEREGGVYGKDDQRIFWDTVVKVLRGELGSAENQPADLSRVWEFVAHNRDGKAPPGGSSPSYKATGLYFPGLKAKPWWERSEFDWLQELEDAAPDIIREMEALARGSGRSYRGGTGEMSTVYDATRGWGTMRIRYMGSFGQPGVNYALLPRTLSALRRLPLAPETAAFQRQLPGTGLPLHVDPSNFVLGCHVGVVIPSPVGPRATDSPVNGAVAAAAATAAGSPHTSKRRGGGPSGKRRSGGTGGGGSGGGGFGFGGGGVNAAGLEKKDGGVSGGSGSATSRDAVQAETGRRRSGSGLDRSQTARITTRSSAAVSTAYRPPSAGPGDGKLAADAVGSGLAATAVLEEDGTHGNSGDHHHPTDESISGSRPVAGGGGGRGGLLARGGEGERAWIEVAGEKRHWETGRAFVFDPSFLHRTHNPTAGERVILNVDIWHPGLEDIEKTAIRRVCELVEQWNSRTGLFRD